MHAACHRMTFSLAVVTTPHSCYPAVLCAEQFLLRVGMSEQADLRDGQLSHGDLTDRPTESREGEHPLCYPPTPPPLPPPIPHNSLAVRPLGLAPCAELSGLMVPPAARPLPSWLLPGGPAEQIHRRFSWGVKEALKNHCVWVQDAAIEFYSSLSGSAQRVRAIL